MVYYFKGFSILIIQVYCPPNDKPSQDKIESFIKNILYNNAIINLQNITDSDHNIVSMRIDTSEYIRNQKVSKAIRNSQNKRKIFDYDKMDENYGPNTLKALIDT